MLKIKCSYSTLLIVLIVLALFFTRFFNLSWGLPYPFHPDERNMVIAIQQLNCSNILDLRDCLNPHFFAYGQFPLYLGYLMAKLFHAIRLNFFAPITSLDATLALRALSAIFSTGTVWLLFKILERFYRGNKTIVLFSLLIFVFSPVLIQSAHFGTTESMLMFFYTALTYLSLLLSQSKISEKRFLFLSSLILGFSIATKISSAIFILPLSLIYISHFKDKKTLLKKIFGLMSIGVYSVFLSLIFSPHNLISIKDFLSSINYEAAVARGMDVFYTRSFVDTIPVLYQFTHVFPYSLGLPVLLLFILGFLFLPWRRPYNLFRLNFLIYFLPTAFLYAKWTRFMAPVFPIMLLVAVLYIVQLYEKMKFSKVVVYLLIFISIIPGIAFMAIYLKPDVRIQASKWIAGNIPPNSYLLSETANVVDIPTPLESKGKPYILNSFDFYHLDESKSAHEDLKKVIGRADYILVPSRRIYKNHTCLNPDQILGESGKHCDELWKEYPAVNDYYEKLFSGKLGFVKVAEFSSYPEVILLGKSIIFSDEESEETWTVFDHPVIRIYKRM